MEGSDRGQILNIILVFARKDWGKPQNSYTDLKTEIFTRKLPKRSRRATTRKRCSSHHFTHKDIVEMEALLKPGVSAGLGRLAFTSVFAAW